MAEQNEHGIIPFPGEFPDFDYSGPYCQTCGNPCEDEGLCVLCETKRLDQEEEEIHEAENIRENEWATKIEAARQEENPKPTWQKHSREPWHAGVYYHNDIYSSKDSFEVRQGCAFNGIAIHAANTQRIIACVNALEGVEKPAEQVETWKHLALKLERLEWELEALKQERDSLWAQVHAHPLLAENEELREERDRLLAQLNPGPAEPYIYEGPCLSCGDPNPETEGYCLECADKAGEEEHRKQVESEEEFHRKHGIEA